MDLDLICVIEGEGESGVRVRVKVGRGGGEGEGGGEGGETGLERDVDLDIEAPLAQLLPAGRTHRDRRAHWTVLLRLLLRQFRGALRGAAFAPPFRVVQ